MLGEEQQVPPPCGPVALPFHATDRSLSVRLGHGAGHALPRLPAPRVVLLMLAHFLTGVVARPAYCKRQHANSKAFAVLDAVPAP